MKRIAVIGGGTGTFVTLNALKEYGFDLSAIISMVDDGGSTGLLRDELGVLPPGDLRQALVALSQSPDVLRSLFNYRFSGKKKGSLYGHSLGNLFISALEKVSGGLPQAIEEIHKILKIKGRVIPVTFSKTRLFATTYSGKLIPRENKIDEYCSKTDPISRIFIRPKALVNQKALEAVLNADHILIGPGDIFTSILPSFLINGFKKALLDSRGKKILNCNLMNKWGHTNKFNVFDYKEIIEKYSGLKLDGVIFNTSIPSNHLVRRYKKEGMPVAPLREKRFYHDKTGFFGFPLMSKVFHKKIGSDRVKRTLIRHESGLFGKALIKVFRELK